MRAALIVLLLIASCGGSEINRSGDLEVTAVEFEFLPAGGSIGGSGATEVIFTNAGSIAHEWVVLSDPIEDEGEFNDDLVLFRLDAQAGETQRGMIDIPDGTYQVVCVIQGHFSAGMEGTLVVTTD